MGTTQAVEARRHTGAGDKRPERLAEHAVVSNRFVTVYMDDVRFPGGEVGTHLRVVEPTGGAAVLVVDTKGKIYLHRGYHYAADGEFLEIIRGFGDRGELAAETALRELAEEAAFDYRVVGDVVQIGEVAPNSTLLAAKVPIFLVTVERGAGRTPNDAMESICAGEWYSSDEVNEMVASGGIVDGFTLAAVMHARARKLIGVSKNVVHRKRGARRGRNSTVARTGS